MAGLEHISVCICTFKRPILLKRLLSRMDELVTQDSFTYSIVVADNHPQQSAQALVDECSKRLRVRIAYCAEPNPNIAAARNRALQNAEGEYVAFIDDDELPVKEWLLELYTACKRFGVEGILGPVKPYFDVEPPAWVKKGRFFERPDPPTGKRLEWAECRTGNVLFKRSILALVDVPFRLQFGTAGEDMDFFRRMIDRGCVFLWCREAPAYELVPLERCRRGFLLKRALLRGSNFPKHPAGRVKSVLKSMVAVPCYTIALPVLAACGHHVFLKYLIKLCDHASRLLAFAGWTVVTERET